MLKKMREQQTTYVVHTTGVRTKLKHTQQKTNTNKKEKAGTKTLRHNIIRDKDKQTLSQ